MPLNKKPFDNIDGDADFKLLDNNRETVPKRITRKILRLIRFATSEMGCAICTIGLIFAPIWIPIMIVILPCIFIFEKLAKWSNLEENPDKIDTSGYNGVYSG